MYGLNINLQLIYIGLFIISIEAQEVTLISTNLPIIVIDTYGEVIPDEPKISAHMGIIFNVSGEINYITDPFNHYDGYIGIEIRGHSSQNFPKKQYGLETRNSEGENLNVSLFGIPKENDWVLYAPYSDKSLMRNVLAYDIARSLGSYAPRTQFCEVILNNDYVGIYVFMEKIKKDSNRVNIYDPEPDNLSGGYLLEVSVLSKIDTTDNYFESESQGRFFVIKFPDEDDITVDQIAWITNYINTFESTLYSGSFNDPDIGYYQYIDSPSWVDYILLNEAFRNNDVFYSSTYLHKKKNGKLFAGPVWDFNIAMGNIDYNDNWLTEGSLLASKYLSSILLEDSSFVSAYQVRWNTLRNNQLTISTINSLIDYYVELLGTAQERNFERWPILGSDVWPNYYIGITYEDEVNYLKQWITDRFIWMDSQLLLEDIEGCIGQLDECGVCEGNGYADWECNDGGTTCWDKADGTCDCDGNIDDCSGICGGNDVSCLSIEELIIPQEYNISSIYPNPFNPVTKITYGLPENTDITISVYNMKGTQITTLVNTFQTAGYHSVNWNADNLPSGVYLIRMDSGDFTQTQKVVLVK